MCNILKQYKIETERDKYLVYIRKINDSICNILNIMLQYFETA